MCARATVAPISYQSVKCHVLPSIANNECSSNPCRNNGQCVDLIGGYECICKGKHSGPNCERGEYFYCTNTAC
ncbi:hypothetical protein GH868_31010 [Bacillus thuringiensis]|nr:hypothetical protein [Bacillus thuringiensis]